MVTLKSHILNGVEAMTLENRLVRMTIVPSLGKPVTSVFDKRSGMELLPEGRTIGLGDSSGGAWQAQGREAGEEPGAAASLFRLTPNLDLDIWAVVSLEPDSPWFTFDVQAHNRTLTIARLSPFFSADAAEMIAADEVAVILPAAGSAGALVRCDLRQDDNGSGWNYSDLSPAVLLGGRTVSARLALAPFGLATVSGAGLDWVAGYDGPNLNIVSQGGPDDVELHVETESGETLKAVVRLSVDTTTQVSTASLPPIKQAALVRDGKVLGKLSPAPRAREESDQQSAMLPGDSNAELAFESAAARWAAADPVASRPLRGLPGTEHIGATVDAIAHSRAKNWPAADAAIDRALTTNGDDPLLWWAKAAVARHAGEDDEALPNAHFLAPMEPLLRVEAFLRQDQAQGADANPLVAPVAADTRAARDCLARLAVWGLWTDFGRLADELLRHADDPVVRYLLAWSLVTQTRMKATAAEHLAAAAPLTIEPGSGIPPVFKTAIQKLAAEFPGDPSLSALLRLS